MERVIEEEKEKRPDLHVLALAYVSIILRMSSLSVFFHSIFAVVVHLVSEKLTFRRAEIMLCLIELVITRLGNMRLSISDVGYVSQQSAVECKCQHDSKL